ncbi:threonine--tRNA ligase [Candidatus Methylacidiphilum fumarolicum]|uniref:Threonine--tRNA ligase n=3 Tax=Candidatus Methylacidiphilum fumarolicum TaxID=591154 RepID=I0JZ73_METFB|nr:threonine--tRNA ligase [Candidatus Methylacidiphilum fumarolicum]TFE74271.1 threonine--tRNA ligase [Candidatus Methylacidiphilum fumarolicum]TFE75770.1 threonine--tRNA ligase [Candidatus Methylacidiphilum fumarolicum]CAI9084756.1 threonine--tRNA ligase [Candidatus Methylacidiphilum fumarolicum]CCG92542.1 threonyl-tRNA synthetase [Methylacidiphilum fumariolicum SolV]
MTQKMNPLEKLRHSAAHVLATAILEIWPEAQLAAGPPVEGGFYYDVELGHRISPEDFPLIEEKMRRIIAERQPFKRIEVSREEARELALKGRLGALSERATPSRYKLDILASIPEDEPITLYQNDHFIDLCAGPHVENTGLIKGFKLTHVSSAYYKGDEKNPQLQRIYGTAFYSEKELEAYLKQLEAAKQRDHRKLGKELELFLIDEEVGPGLPLWLPKGAIIRAELQVFLTEELQRRGYQLVHTPHIGSLDLFRISGHYPYYRDSQFPPILEPAELKEYEQKQMSCAELANRLEKGEVSGYLLKPMNCPMHIRIFSSKPRSYKDLPIRLAEFGTVYRFEKSGELSGLTRVRGFTQDDAHIFCMESQVEAELLSCLELVKVVVEKLGLTDAKARLGLRGEDKEKYVGSAESWQKAERDLRKAAEDSGINFVEELGEAAFYGPKVDFLVKDAIGRLWQLGTVQLDYNLPLRFSLSYVGEDGNKERPVMIHRAPFGSMERFLAILIEHFEGHFPLWLAPEQVRVIPLSDAFVPYGQKVTELLQQHKFRVTLDRKNETLGAKIRIAQLEKVPYMLIVGKKEEQMSTVSVRTAKKGNLGEMELEAFLSLLLTEYKERRI